jgi:UDP-N-acetylmuramyl pentapeptide synthase
MLVEKVGGIVIINDCYNCKPKFDETKRFLHYRIFFAVVKGTLHSAICESWGDSSLDEHIAVIEKADDCADKVIITGSEMLKLSRIYHKLRISILLRRKR